MGVLRWFDRIEPARWRDACERLAREPIISKETLVAFLGHYGCEADETSLAELEGPEGSSGADLGRLHFGRVCNRALEAATTVARWDLDKALGSFVYLPKLVPALAPLALVIDFGGIDVPVPRVASGGDSGLFGCVSASALQPLRRALEQHPTLDVVKDTVSAKHLRSSPPFLARLLGRTPTPADLRERMRGEDRAWLDLVAAVTEATRHGHHLGLGMLA